MGLASPPKPGKGALGTRLDVVDKNRQQSVVSFFFSFLLPMPYTPKALIKTFVKSKVVQFIIDTVDLSCLADRCYIITFVFATIPEPAIKLSIYGYRKDPRAGNVEGSSKSP